MSSLLTEFLFLLCFKNKISWSYPEQDLFTCKIIYNTAFCWVSSLWMSWDHFALSPWIKRQNVIRVNYIKENGISDECRTKCCDSLLPILGTKILVIVSFRPNLRHPNRLLNNLGMFSIPVMLDNKYRPLIKFSIEGVRLF